MAKIKQQLLEQLIKKLGCKQRQVYRLITKKSQQLMLPRNLAALVLASEKNININKFASQEDMTTIRQALVPQVSTMPVEPTLPTKSPTKKSKPNSGFPDPFIDAGVVSAAYRNAELYPIVYIFENSVRNVVLVIMKSKFGDDWWEQKVSEKIRKSVKIRQSEEKQYPWHSQRGSEPIFYTDITDLRTIINTYNNIFKKVFGKIPRVELWIEEIEKTRNILAHNNPVAKKDRERLAVFAYDWSKLAKKIFSENLE